MFEWRVSKPLVKGSLQTTSLIDLFCTALVALETRTIHRTRHTRSFGRHTTTIATACVPRASLACNVRLKGRLAETSIASMALPASQRRCRMEKCATTATVPLLTPEELPMLVRCYVPVVGPHTIDLTPVYLVLVNTGLRCEAQSTSFCTKMGDHNGHQFCVNGGK